MKITKSRLKQIIKEELSAVSEGLEDDIAADQARRGYTPQPSNIPSGFASSKDYYETLGSPDPKDIQLLQALKEVLEASGRRVGPYGLSKELRRLAEIAAKNPEFDTEEPETDEEAPELPEAPSTRSMSHQRRRKFRNP